MTNTTTIPHVSLMIVSDLPMKLNLIMFKIEGFAKPAYSTSMIKFLIGEEAFRKLESEVITYMIESSKVSILQPNEIWCECGNPSGEFKYYEDGEGFLVNKHHYCCKDCTKVIQIG